MDRSDVHNKACNWQYEQNELDSRDTTHLHTTSAQKGQWMLRKQTKEDSVPIIGTV